MNRFCLFLQRGARAATAENEYETVQFKVFVYIFNDPSSFIGKSSILRFLGKSWQGRRVRVLLVRTAATWKNSVHSVTLHSITGQQQRDQFSCPGHPESESHKEYRELEYALSTDNCWPIFPFVNN